MGAGLARAFSVSTNRVDLLAVGLGEVGLDALALFLEVEVPGAFLLIGTGFSFRLGRDQLRRVGRRRESLEATGDTRVVRDRPTTSYDT